MKPLVVFDEAVFLDQHGYSSNSSWLGYAIALVDSFGGGAVWVPLGEGRGRNTFLIPSGIVVSGSFYYDSFLSFYKKYPFFRNRTLRYLAEAIECHDLVIVRAPAQLAGPLVKICKKLNKPLVVVYAGDFINAASPLQRKGVLSRILRFAALYIDNQQRNLGVSSRSIISVGKDVLLRYGLSSNSLVITDSTISSVDIERGWRRNENYAGPIRLVRIAAYLPNKNYELLFDMVRHLQSQGWKGVVNCYGVISDQNYYNELRRIAPKDVYLNAAIPAGRAVLDVLLESDLQIICSKSEGIPRTILEGAASGVALVSLDIGGIPDLVTHEKDALLIEAEKKSEQELVSLLAASVSRLEHNPELRNKLVKNGFDLASEMTREKTVEKMKHFILKSLKNG